MKRTLGAILAITALACDSGPTPEQLQSQQQAHAQAQAEVAQQEKTRLALEAKIAALPQKAAEIANHPAPCPVERLPRGFPPDYDRNREDFLVASCGKNQHIYFDAQGELTGRVERLPAPKTWLAQRIDNGEVIERTKYVKDEGGYDVHWSEQIGGGQITRAYSHMPVLKVTAQGLIDTGTAYSGYFGGDGEHVLPHYYGKGVFFVVKTEELDAQRRIIYRDGELFNMNLDHYAPFIDARARGSTIYALRFKPRSPGNDEFEQRLHQDTLREEKESVEFLTRAVPKSMDGGIEYRKEY